MSLKVYRGRTLARSQALQLLFQAEATDSPLERVLEGDFLISKGPLDPYALELCRGAYEHIDRIDCALRSVAKNWDLMRMPGADRKIKGKTLHWVSCAHAVKAEVRLYDRLWKVENPRDEMAAIRDAQQCDAVTAMKQIINPDSLHVLTDCYVEEFAAGMKPLSYLQFQRIGYFNVDTDSTPEHLVFNKTVGLRDTYAKGNR